ncbi:MAG: 2'-deoxycytidine 5'-triphosphate deaminase [Methylobacterium mesophilicum]|nr:2'-deoxycytidine 5'-triphosphate deaminase [Methylobacterium mesophilicum]
MLGQPLLFGVGAADEDQSLRGLPVRDPNPKFGLMPRQRIRAMIDHKMIMSTVPIEDSQLQPASLDLRLGARAYRVRASFLPGQDKSVAARIAQLGGEEISLENGAIFEQNCVYVVELMEHLKLPQDIAAVSNPKSSTGRIDVFTRLITDGSDSFDTISKGYQGKLYAEVSPRSFSIKVRKGTKLNQIRFRLMNSQQGMFQDFEINDKELRRRHGESQLVDDGEPTLRRGLILRVGLSHGDSPDGVIGYRAQKFAGIIDLENIGRYKVEDFWEAIRARPDGQLTLDPHHFYILASSERLHIPQDVAAEMEPIDPTMGEFRVHYAGFFDPGFGYSANGHLGSRAVLEVRSHEVPFVLEDKQIIGRLVFYHLSETPDQLYGQGKTSNYQGQGLKLSKHFAQPA